MIVAAIATVIGLACCLIDLGRGTWSLLVYGFGILLIGAASSVYSLARQSCLTEMVPPHMRPVRCPPSAAPCASGCSLARSSGLERRSCGGCRAPTTSAW